MTNEKLNLEEKIAAIENGLERCREDIAVLNGTSHQPQPFRLPLDQTKRGVVAVLACIVQALSEHDPSLSERVCANLEGLDKQLLDNGSPHGSDIVFAMTKALGKSS